MMVKKKEEQVFGFEKAEDSPGFLLWQVTNMWQREIKKALEPLDLTHSQFVLLASVYWLTMQKKDVTQINLSAHTKIDPMSTSSVLKALQTKGLIERHEHHTDTRAKTVALTEAGKKLTAEAVKIVENFDNIFFGALGKRTGDFNGMLGTLMAQSV